MLTQAKLVNLGSSFINSSENSRDLKNQKESKGHLSDLPLSEYAKKLDSVVKTR